MADEKTIHEIKGKIKVTDAGDGNIVIRTTEPTTIVSKSDMKEVAKKITDS